MADVAVNIKSDISDVEKDVIKLSRELRDAKLAFKDLEKGTEEYAKKKSDIDNLTKAFNSQKDALQDLRIQTKKTTEGFAEAKDKIGDLKDEALTLQGSGIERLKSSFGLLTEGFSNFDGGKIKTAFSGIGAAMKAIPIFLIVEGIMYLVQNFNELSKGSGILAKSLQFVGDILSAIGDGITWLTDNIGLTNSALEEMGDKAVKMAEDSKDALASQSAEYDRLAKEAKAAGKSTVEFERAKQQAIIDTNIAILKQLLAFKESGGELSEEQQKLLKTSTAALKAATTERKIIDIEEKKDIEKRNKEAYDKWYAYEQKKIDDKYKAWKNAKDRAKEEADFEQRAQEELDKMNLEQRADYVKIYNEQEAQLLADRLSESAQAQEEADKKSEAKVRSKEETKLQIEKDSIAAAKELSDLFFEAQLKGAEGDERRQLEIKKRAFQVNKAFQASQAAIDGTRATLSAFATAPPGFKIAAAAAAGIFAAAQVAKILAARFNPGSAPSNSSGGGIRDINTGGGVNPAAQPIPQRSQDSTQFDESGNRVTKVVVLASDIKDVTRSVARVEEQAKF